MRKTLLGQCTALAAFGAMSLLSSNAFAQQKTFHLDRLEIPGGPEDTIALFRPVTQPRLVFFGQIAAGYQRNPIHTANIISANDATTKAHSDSGLIQNQLTFYATAGLQFLNRFSVAVTAPITLWQSGNNPNYANSAFGGSLGNAVITDGAHMNDMRIDARAVLVRTDNDRGAFGVQGALFAPAGDYAAFGSDGGISGLLGVSAEYNIRVTSSIDLVLGANLGMHFRPSNSLNYPKLDAGLGVGNEVRWALGAHIPINGGKFRVGANLFGQWGFENNDTIGNTFFKQRNNAIEWQGEGRMKFGDKDRFWTGVGLGTLLQSGYGAPDFRAVLLLGVQVPLGAEEDTQNPDAKDALRTKWRKEREMEKGSGWKDSDGDGIADEVDACPNEPEDHEQPDPGDGCPKPADRDGDGIPDALDKCPDQAEDKDGVDDSDGCPETDADADGIPDAQDACPKEPGSPSKDPGKNGCPLIQLVNGKIEVLQQVHFATGKATILADSFPMLTEIANLLRKNAQIQRMSIEGHTDNAGNAAKNQTLSQDRANSVSAWLTQHGIDAGRLEAHGYGQTQPIADNKTKAGRDANRRCEFKILKEDK